MCKVDEEPWLYTFCIRGVICTNKYPVTFWIEFRYSKYSKTTLYTYAKVLNDFHSIPIYHALGFNLSTSLICYSRKNISRQCVISLFKTKNTEQYLRRKICDPDFEVYFTGIKQYDHHWYSYNRCWFMIFLFFRFRSLTTIIFLYYKSLWNNII